MSRRLLGFILLLALSLGLGLFTGQRFFQLFLTTVPPMSQSALMTSTAHAACLFYGFVLGIVICAWGVLAVALSRFFRDSGAPGAAPD